MDYCSNNGIRDYPEGWDRGPQGVTDEGQQDRQINICTGIRAENTTDIGPKGSNNIPEITMTKTHDPPPSYDSLYANAVDRLEDPSYVDTVASDDSTTALIKDELLKLDMVAEVNVTEITPSIGGNDEKYMQYLSTEEIPHNNTQPLVLESPAYIDEMHCGSTNDLRLIARACRNAVMTLSQDVGPNDLRDDKLQSKPDVTSQVIEYCEEISQHTKNLLILSVSVFFVTVTNSLRSLQSSLNPDGGLGLYSLAGYYSGFMLFSLFSPFVVQWLRPKRCLLLGILPHTLYVLANTYPTFAIFIPSSILLGAGSALLWNGISTYITYLARSYALLNDLRTVHIASKYFGVLFFFFQFSVVAGNLVSSLVLMFGANNTQEFASIERGDGSTLFSSAPSVLLPILTPASSLNDSLINYKNTSDIIENVKSKPEVGLVLCGSQYCHLDGVNLSTVEQHSGVDDNTKYMLFGIYGLSSVFALVLVGLLLDPLKPYRSTLAKCELVCHQLKSIFKCFINRKFLLLFFAFAFSNMQSAFVAGEITKAFVTCPFGIYMVGYTMICLGVCAGVSSYLGGHFNKLVSHRTILILAAITNLVLLGVLTVWRIQPDQLILCFVFIGVWGITDGIWFSQTSSLISDVFPDCLEEAFAAQRIVQGLGAAVSFTYAPYLCMTMKILILAAVCLCGLLLLIVQGFLDRKASREMEEEEEQMKV